MGWYVVYWGPDGTTQNFEFNIAKEYQYIHISQTWGVCAGWYGEAHMAQLWILDLILPESVIKFKFILGNVILNYGEFGPFGMVRHIWYTKNYFLNSISLKH